MRLIVDANVLVSAVLPSGAAPGSVIRRLFHAIYFGDHVLLVPGETILEARSKLATKPWLVRNVPATTVKAFFTELRSIAEFVPAIAYLPPARCRDRKDDYLLEQAIRFRADILVTGDDDLLALDGTIEGLRILLPRTLLDELTAGTN